jgi:hypothetical protein
MLEQDAAAELREGIGNAATSDEMRALVATAEKSKLVDAELVEWAARVIEAKRKDEVRQAKLAAAEAERKKKIAEEEAARKLEQLKKKRRRLLKGKAKSVVQMVGAQQRGTNDRLEQEALMAEHRSALEELKQLREEFSEEQEVELATVAQEEELRREQIAALQSSLAKAEEEAEAAKKLVTIYHVKLRNVIEPNEHCDRWSNECTVVLHGEHDDSPPFKLSKKGLWAAKEEAEVKVSCPKELGRLGMITVDDGARGAVAARVLSKVVVMRKKSYDPPSVFSNALAEDQAKPFDRMHGVLQLTTDLPTLKELASEDAKAKSEETQPEPEPEPEPVPAP